MDEASGLAGEFTGHGGVDGVQLEEVNGGGGSVFLPLKSNCLELLELLQNPKKHSPAIPSLLHLLRTSPPHFLQPFFDYALFPLLLLLDAAVNCRSTRKVDSQDKHASFNELKSSPYVSDNVAEGVLQCLEELLKKCRVGSVDQMVVVLKKLTYGALLSPSEASEEFREGVIKCFRVLLLSLLPCSDETCLCKTNCALSALLRNTDLEATITSPPQGECLLAFLHSQSGLAAVGHWLSLLLKTADTEVARGHRGSAKLRVEAFITLRVLIARVGSADALAFFLPGVVSQFAKVLHVSKTMISGAAGSMDALNQAIRGLAEYLTLVLQDDANISSLNVSSNVVNSFDSNKTKSTHSYLEELRQLPVKTQGLNKVVPGDSGGETVDMVTSESNSKDCGYSNSGNGVGSFHVNRTKDWIESTSAHVNKLLSTTFPHICVHPSKKVRLGLLSAIQGMLLKCSYTLKECRMMLLECVCVLVVDDAEDVSVAAQEFLENLFLLSGKQHVEQDVAEIFVRLIEKLPKVVLESEESLALSHAQKLLVVIYYSGPRLLVDYLLQSPVRAARFLDIFSICLSQNSVFAGSLDKLMLARPSSTGYLHSVTELESGRKTLAIMNDAVKENEIHHSVEDVQKIYKLPHMPPWFAYVGSSKLYEALAGILRLVGLSLMADSRSEGHLSVITDIPLGHLRKLVSEIRVKEYNKENWQSWYNRTGSGHLIRQASTAACILNEMIFGLSEQSKDIFKKRFQKSRTSREGVQEHDTESVWKFSQLIGEGSQIIDCTGRILHEYVSPELWNLPVEHKSSVQSDGEAEDIALYFFQDTAMLHQVAIDGIGIFNICLGKYFASSGFLHTSLYMLLENLICSNFQVKSASDSVLHVLAATSGYATVGHLVVENADYIIDSICKQLRHLNLNPHVPAVLAAMLSYVGVAHKILALLEEPMRSVSAELEILGRHQHPDLTIPFLKSVAEITKAAKLEACSLPRAADSFSENVKSKLSCMEKKAKTKTGEEDLESILFEFNDSKRYRRMVGSIAGSCLIAATPLLASPKQPSCLISLEIIENGIIALAKVEEAYRHEKEVKETIESLIQLCSFYHIQDTLDADEGVDENRLLPAVNKIWPFLVICVQNNNPMVARRCLTVVTNTVQISGGDFFARRFHKDGPSFWKLLSTSPFKKKPFSKQERTPLQLPYRNNSVSTEDTVAEASSIKVQAAVLNMIAELSRNKRSASALEVDLKKVSGLVVGIACSGVVGLRDASVKALQGLACIDPDLVWLLLADVYYSKKKDVPPPPASGFPELSRVLPPPSSPKGYVYAQYAGQTYGFDIDFSSVGIVFRTMYS